MACKRRSTIRASLVDLGVIAEGTDFGDAETPDANRVQEPNRFDSVIMVIGGQQEAVEEEDVVDGAAADDQAN